MTNSVDSLFSLKLSVIECSVVDCFFQDDADSDERLTRTQDAYSNGPNYSLGYMIAIYCANSPSHETPFSFALFASAMEHFFRCNYFVQNHYGTLQGNDFVQDHYGTTQNH